MAGLLERLKVQDICDQDDRALEMGIAEQFMGNYMM